MADKRMTVEFMRQERRSEALSGHAAFVVRFRDKLAVRTSPLDSISAEQLEQARREFRELPEVAGQPLPSSDHLESDNLVGILRDAIVALVRRDGPDLSARQLGVFLTCYLEEGPHTVRVLAADLNLSKPAVTRVLDRLGELDLARRKTDPNDRRGVLIQRTLRGIEFLRDLRGVLNEVNRATHASVAERRYG